LDKTLDHAVQNSLGVEYTELIKGLRGN